MTGWNPGAVGLGISDETRSVLGWKEPRRRRRPRVGSVGAASLRCVCAIFTRMGRVRPLVAARAGLGAAAADEDDATRAGSDEYSRRRSMFVVESKVAKENVKQTKSK